MIRPEALRREARRAYEIGRLKGAFLRGAGACALGLPGYLAFGRTPPAAACLAAFVLAVIVGRVLGRRIEEGVRAGVAAGVLPCLLPALARLLDGDLCRILFDRGPWLCAFCGLAAGVILGWRSRAAGGPSFWIGAAATLAPAAALGCFAAGLMGSAGLLAGVVAGGLPALAMRRAAA